MAFSQLNRLHLENLQLTEPWDRCKCSICPPLNEIRGKFLPYLYNSFLVWTAIVLFFVSLRCYTNNLGVAATFQTTFNSMKCMSHRCIESTAPCPGLSDLPNFPICPIKADFQLFCFTKIWRPIQIIVFHSDMIVHVSPYLVLLGSNMTTRALKILANDLSLSSAKTCWGWDNTEFLSQC